MDENNQIESNNFDIDPIEMDGFDFEPDIDKRYIKPKKIKPIKDRFIVFSNAQKMAAELTTEKNVRYFCVVSGNFIFGDIIEAFIMKHKLKVKHLIISTLSMSENNIDSLGNLIEWKILKKLDLIVSDYFYSHEKYQLIPYIYTELDNKDCDFQLSVCRSHTKITLLETECGKYFVFHGSANLRSSDNIEQFCIEENEDLFYFNKQWHEVLINEYKTINKRNKVIGGHKLWQAVQQAVGVEVKVKANHQQNKGVKRGSINQQDLRSDNPEREVKF